MKFVSGKKYRLAGSGCTDSATSIILQSFKLPDDATSITMTDFGSIGYGVLEPKTSNVELISFTGVTQNGDGTATLTGVTRGLKFNADYSADSALKKAHAGAAIFIISNTPQFYDELSGKDNDETITGDWNFSGNAPSAASAPVDATDLTNKTYVDNLVNGGTVSQNRVVIVGNAGEVVSAGQLVYLDVADGEWKLCDADTAASVENVMLGIAQGAGTDGNAITNGVLLYGLDSNQSGLTNNTKYYASNTAGGLSSSAGTKEVSIGISRSTTSILFLPRFDQMLTEDEQDAVASLAQAVLPYAADAGANDTYVVTLAPAPTAYTAGMVVNFKANTANTGAATLNVNGLGAKTIVKNYNLTLHDGDIKANQLVSVIYDGTNFQLLSPVTPVYKSGVTTRDISTASGNQTIAHGLGTAPRRIRISGRMIDNREASPLVSISEGTYDGTTTTCVFATMYGQDVSEEQGTSTTFIIKIQNSTNWPNSFATATVTVDATNITLAWTKADAAAGTAQILWEAWGG